MLKRDIVRPPLHIYPPDEWRIVEARFAPAYLPRAETVFALSNGYLGVRGTLEEGRPATAPGTFVNGFHETWPIRHSEEAYGLARVGQTIVNLPDACRVELFVDDEPLFLPTARLRQYERVLDMRNGVLTRELLWSTAAGKHVRVRSRRLVSFEHRHVLAISFEVTVDAPSPVVLCSRVVRHDSHQRPHVDGALLDPRVGRELDGHTLTSRFADCEDGQLHLGYRTARSGMSVAIGVDHEVDSECAHRVTASAGADASEVVVVADAEAGVPVRLEKFATYQTSREVPAETLRERCGWTIERARAGGFSELAAAQRRHLDLFWDRADVVVEDRRVQVRAQQAVRWNLFQLAQATWRAEGSGIPAKGLTGAAYDGHYFWDTEAYVLPFLAYTQPRSARNLLRFRHSMLPKARERAATLGQRGATFPWRTINGEEASAYFQAGTAQYHLNADIAYGIRRYVDVRGDEGFLVEAGAEILVETARMWEDLGFRGPDGRFHIHGVTGPDEYTTVVNDNAFTNLMARHNLRYAASTVRRLAGSRPEAFEALRAELGLEDAEVEAWDGAADRMHVPHDEARGIMPQDEGFLGREVWDLAATPADKFPLLLHFHPLAIYRRQVLKQADVVMAMFMLGNEFDVEEKRRNFEYYDRLTTGDSSLSASVQSIVAAEIGDEESACEYFDFALLMDLCDIAGNASDGVHIASSAGAWMAIVFGFGGVRDHGGQLAIDPRLPSRWESVAFSLRFQDRQLRVHLGHARECYRIDEGEPLDVRIRGRRHRLAVGSPLELAVPAP
ncbi:MAG TPA: glycosyl hydrolase family 65 protein [Acidimicrobiales bacterium]|nr:glycosyl hydrolase family 65 protein [Acidimicrobiales bacterium]